MKKDGRLTLDEVKAKASAINKSEALEKVRGGNFKDCHGFLGPIWKYSRGEADTIKWYIN